MRWLVAALLLALPVLAWAFPARAHEDAAWIMANPETSWCCGPHDCEAIEDESVAIVAEGVLVKATQETILYQDLKQSIDNRWWRCRHPSGNTRCLFRPPFGS